MKSKKKYITFGKIKHMGWDIDTPWAIDADKQCWIGGGHGEALTLVSVKELFNEAESDEDKEEIAKALGIDPPELSWQKKARAAGWASPKEKSEGNWKKLLEEYKDLAYEDGFRFLEAKGKKRQIELEKLLLEGLMK